jgi:hypothetical protein
MWMIQCAARQGGYQRVDLLVRERHLVTPVIIGKAAYAKPARMTEAKPRMKGLSSRKGHRTK